MHNFTLRVPRNQTHPCRQRQRQARGALYLLLTKPQEAHYKHQEPDVLLWTASHQLPPANPWVQLANT